MPLAICSGWSVNGVRYEDRLSRVSAYIHDHLDDALDLETLAGVAAMSPWHWHRIYAARFGEAVFATVKRLRLQRAASELANGDLPVARIGRRAGYTTLPSFVRAFKAVYGLPPALYRRAGSHTRFHSGSGEGKAIMYDVEIRDLPPQTALTVPHRGAYMEIGRAFEQLGSILGPRGLFGYSTGMVAIYLDDPESVPEKQLNALAGITVTGNPPAEPPLSLTPVRSGRYAVLKHKGPYADMKAAYNWLLGTWLVQSGEEAASAPMLETYLNAPADTPPLELRTDIHLPLEPRDR
jgi:AraC family transcriptional regulator